MEEGASAYPFPVIGIDIGQSTISGCVFANNEYLIVSDSVTGRMIPDAIRFDNKIAFGDEVKAGSRDTSLVLKNLKNLIGLKNIPDEIINSLQGCSVIRDEQGIPKIRFENNVQDMNGEPSIYPEFAFALLLRHVVVQGSIAYGCAIKNAVIAIPSTYTLKQIHVLKKCASYIGLNILRLVVGPQAFTAYTLLSNPSFRGNMNVYDLGGDNFVFSSLCVDDDGIKLLATTKDTENSGYGIDDFFDSRLHESIDESVNHPFTIDAEQLKIDLSVNDIAPLIIDNQQYDITRQLFDQCFEYTWGSITHSLQSFIAQSPFPSPELQPVYVCGGNANIPSLQQAFMNLPTQVTMFMNSDQSIVTECLVLGIDLIQDNSSLQTIPIQNCLLHNLYYSFNQRGSYHLFNAFTPLQDCKKIINHIPSFLSSTKRIYICDSKDSWLGYFEIPVELIHDDDYGCYFHMDDSYELYMDIVIKDRKVLCKCEFHYYDELPEKDIQSFKLVNEYTDIVRRIIAEFSKPEYSSSENVNEILNIMSSNYERESVLQLYPLEDDSIITGQIQEFTQYYYEYYKNSI